MMFIEPGSMFSQETWPADTIEGSGGEAPCWKDIRSSCALDKEGLIGSLSHRTDYDKVLKSCARNVQLGEFTASSWKDSWTTLNAVTNFFDKNIAPSLTRIFLDVIAAHFKPHDSKQRVLVLGKDMVGCVMAGQCAALAHFLRPGMLEWCDFAYFDKDRRKQLDGPTHVAERTEESPALKAILLDDVQSSGASLRDAALLLKKDYNIDVVGAVYLVDRPMDRKSLEDYLLGATDAVLQNTKIIALYDIEDIDAEVQRNVSGLLV